MRCCLLPETKHLRDYRHGSGGTIRAQGKGENNWKSMQMNSWHSVQFWVLQSVISIQLHNVSHWFMWNPPGFWDSWLSLMNLSFHICFGASSRAPCMFVCLGQVFAALLLTGMAGSAECLDARCQEFLAHDDGTTTVHLGRAHLIKIHPHSTVLILVSINTGQKIACL